MAKYGPKSQEKVEKTMHEFKEGKLKSGKSGKKVTNPKQAIAIGLSEARESGAKVQWHWQLLRGLPRNRRIGPNFSCRLHSSLLILVVTDRYLPIDWLTLTAM